MLHLLATTALCIFIGERLVRWLSIRGLMVTLGATAATAIVLGGGIFFATILWPAVPYGSCEMHTLTYQELVDHGNPPDLAEFKVRTGANYRCQDRH